MCRVKNRCRNTAKNERVRKLKRSAHQTTAVQPPNLEAAKFPSLVEACHQAKQEIEDGMAAELKPHHKKLRDNIRLAIKMLAEIERYARGEITEAQFRDLESEIPERFQVPSPPEYLPDNVAWLLLKDRAAGNELTGWIKEVHKKPLGRPGKLQNYMLGQEAARLKDHERLSWGQIVRKLCPERKNLAHHCSKKCEDRIRDLAKRFRN